MTSSNRDLSKLFDAEKAVRQACSVVAAKSDSDSTELQNAEALGSVVGEFFAQTEKESFPELVIPLKARPEYAQEIFALKKVMIAFRRDVVAARRVGGDSSVNNKLRASTARVAQQMNKVNKVYIAIVDNNCEGEVRKTALDIGEAVADGSDGYDPVCAEKVEETPAEPRGMTGSAALGKFFSDHAALERNTADRLRMWVIILLALIAALALWILFLSPLDSDALGRAFARLSTTVPLAVLAGYLGRESSRHRTAADRSREIGANLTHLDDYVAELSEEQRRQYRYELGQSAYVADRHGVDDAISPGFVEEVARRLAEAIKGLASR